MPRYRGRIRLVILDLAGTVCDGPQDLRRLYPADDGKAVKSPVVAFDRIFTKHGMAVDWATIRKPMGLFKISWCGPPRGTSSSMGSGSATSTAPACCGSGAASG